MFEGKTLLVTSTRKREKTGRMLHTNTCVFIKNRFSYVLPRKIYTRIISRLYLNHVPMCGKRCAFTSSIAVLAEHGSFKIGGIFDEETLINRCWKLYLLLLLLLLLSCRLKRFPCWLD